LLALS
jgi:hypothetical protein